MKLKATKKPFWRYESSRPRARIVRPPPRNANLGAWEKTPPLGWQNYCMSSWLLQQPKNHNFKELWQNKDWVWWKNDAAIGRPVNLKILTFPKSDNFHETNPTYKTQTNHKNADEMRENLLARNADFSMRSNCGAKKTTCCYNRFVAPLLRTGKKNTFLSTKHTPRSLRGVRFACGKTQTFKVQIEKKLFLKEIKPTYKIRNWQFQVMTWFWQKGEKAF